MTRTRAIRSRVRLRRGTLVSVAILAGIALLVWMLGRPPGCQARRCLAWETVTYPAGAYSCYAGRKAGSGRQIRTCGVDVEPRTRRECTRWAE